MENILNNNSTVKEYPENKLLSLENRIKVLENKEDDNKTNTVATDENGIHEKESESNVNNDQYENEELFPPNIPQLDGGIFLGGNNMYKIPEAAANLTPPEEIRLGNDGYQIGVLYPCDGCDSKFSHENIMLEHKRKKHNVNRTKKKEKGRP